MHFGAIYLQNASYDHLAATVTVSSLIEFTELGSITFAVGFCIIFNKFLLNAYLFQTGGVAFSQKNLDEKMTKFCPTPKTEDPRTTVLHLEHY